jgi:hypothetical protein
MGVSGPRAHQIVQKALDEIRENLAENANAVIAMELERLDEMLLGLWEKAKAGDLGAVEKAIRIMERRAKLLGLDAPSKVAPTDPSGEHPAAGVFVMPPMAESIEEWQQQHALPNP